MKTRAMFRWFVVLATTALLATATATAAFADPVIETEEAPIAEATPEPGDVIEPEPTSEGERAPSESQPLDRDDEATPLPESASEPTGHEGSVIAPAPGDGVTIGVDEPAVIAPAPGPDATSSADESGGFDPEWLLVTGLLIASAMLGLAAGWFLAQPRRNQSIAH